MAIYPGAIGGSAVSHLPDMCEPLSPPCRPAHPEPVCGGVCPIVAMHPGGDLLRQRTRGRTRLYSLRWIAGPVLAVPLGLLTLCVLIMVAGVTKPGGSALLVAIFALLALGILFEAVWMLAILLRPITITRSAMRIPSGFKTVVVPLDDVAGVGLLYHSFRPPRGSPRAWSVFIWRRNGSVQRAGSLICRRGPDAPPRQIAGSRAAKMARRIDGKIRAIQGPAGNLARLELQKHGNVSITDDIVAFWSPDGDMGPTRI